MHCESCGRLLPGEKTFCEKRCVPGKESSPAPDPDRDRPPLLTDGGEPDFGEEDDPLADPGEESGDEEYLDPEDIVDEEDMVTEPQENPDGESPDRQPRDDPAPDRESQSDQSAGGQPREEQSVGEQPHDEQPANQQPPGQQPPQSGQPQGTGQPSGEGGQSRSGKPQPGAGGPGQPTGNAGDPLGGQQTAGETQQAGDGLVTEIRRYPLRLGTALGAVAFLIPYLLITLATFFGYEQPPGKNTEQVLSGNAWQVVEGSGSWSELDVSAELFFYVVELGSGGQIVDLYRRAAAGSLPSEIDPASYQTVEKELGALLELLALDGAPDVPLLLLFILAPYVLFVSSRYLARNYTPGESPLAFAVAGSTVTIGTLIVTLLIGLVFPVTDLAGRLLFAGLFIPATVGTVGGLSIWAFDDHSALVSTLVGWAMVVIGIGVAFLLLPIPSLGLPEEATLSLSLLDRLVIAVGAYLNVAQFNIGAHSTGRLFFLLVSLLTVGGGFFRAWQARESIHDRMDGARVGSSIFLGHLALVALLLWVFPMATALVDVSLTQQLTLQVQPAAIDGIDSFGFGLSSPGVLSTVQSVTTRGEYIRAIIVGGALYPMTFGAIGGYLAVMLRDR